ncbi:hypothetical protein WA026_010708 [Henosepilachna vigintioctopunctata]|uniref:Beta-glucosidase n=1 Tax=Henosepilachna vigintioctopunctata TaxID=420089 RepID=A0AAW1UQV8_9CUCU
MKFCESVFIISVFIQLVSTELSSYNFPENFVFGVATAAYQIEGAFNEDGKTDSIWDYNLHKKPDWVIDQGNGDVACDSYHKWEEDIQLIANLGVDFYRFSIAWTRIFPSGYAGSKINDAGVIYYNKLIDGLLAKGITPMVTIYHWDLPQNLQRNGGWMNETIVDNYVFYARTLFELYGDRVKHWITFNEPFQICESGYSETDLAPFLNDSGVGGYICAHNLLISHGRAYREYERTFKQNQGGKVAITAHSFWFEPQGESDSDRAAAERAMQFWYGWFMHPVIKGNYPPIMIERIDEISQKEGFQKSRLPKFTEGQIEMIRGSFDFIGVNHYTTALASISNNFNEPSFYFDGGVNRTEDSNWVKSSTSTWLNKVPWGLRKLLNWIKQEYNNPPVLITENGWSSSTGLEDSRRVSYLNEYLSELLKAIHEDECNVIGYTHWSLLDNFEWLKGYTARFGLVEVDFNNPDRTRTPRKSYGVYQKIISSRKIN